MASTLFAYSPTTGTGNTIISVSANTVNSGTADKNATITISNTANSATVALKQLYCPTFNQIASTNFPATGGNIYFTVHSEYDVVFRSVPNWITISYNGTQYSEGERISSGVVDNKTFTLTAPVNTGQQRYEHNMNMGHYIGNTLQNYYTYFSFTQDGAVDPKSIKVQPTSMSVSSSATATAVTITTENCTYHHQTNVSGGSFPITVSGVVNNILLLSFPANTGPQRVGTLTFTLYDTDGNSYVSTVSITQAAYVAPTVLTKTITATTSVDNLGAGTLSVDLDTVSYNGYTDSKSFTLNTIYSQSSSTVGIKYLSDGNSPVVFMVTLQYKNGQGVVQTRNFNISANYGNQTASQSVSTGNQAVFTFYYDSDNTPTITIYPLD